VVLVAALVVVQAPVAVAARAVMAAADRFPLQHP